MHNKHEERGILASMALESIYLCRHRVDLRRQIPLYLLNHCLNVVIRRQTIHLDLGTSRNLIYDWRNVDLIQICCGPFSSLLCNSETIA